MLKKKTKKKILIIGAGPVGCTVAEILSKYSFDIKILETRNHIGGNCYDYKNKSGILVHKYGLHYFRTNSKNILNYLSKFTEWIPGDYQVNSFVDNTFYDFPINLNTINKFLKKNLHLLKQKSFYQEWLKKSLKKKKIFKRSLFQKLAKNFMKNFIKIIRLNSGE